MTIRRAVTEDLHAIATVDPRGTQWPPGRYDVLVAESGVTVAGFLAWREIAAGEYELLDIAVAPTQRRHGIGERLIRAAINEHPGTWFLEVRESNTAAIRLYRKLGFEEAGRRPGYYEDPLEGGVVMSFHS